MFSKKKKLSYFALFLNSHKSAGTTATVNCATCNQYYECATFIRWLTV